MEKVQSDILRHLAAMQMPWRQDRVYLSALMNVLKAFEARGFHVQLTRDADLFLGYVSRRPELYVLDRNAQLAPELSPLTPERFLGQLILDQSGKVVATQVSRLREIGTKSLADAMRDLTFWYDDPDTNRSDGETCEVWAPTPERMSGKISWSTAIGVDHSQRRHGIGHLITELGKLLVTGFWDVDWHCGGMGRQNTHKQGRTDAWGHMLLEDGIRWTKPGWFINRIVPERTGALSVNLVISDRAYMEGRFETLAETPDSLLKPEPAATVTTAVS